MAIQQLLFSLLLLEVVQNFLLYFIDFHFDMFDPYDVVL